MLQSFLESEKLQELCQLLREGQSVLVEELWDSPKALLSTLVQTVTGKHILFFTGSSLEESRLYHDFSQFSERPVVHFPAWETLPSENVPPSPDIVGERYQVIQSILESKEPLIILTTLQSALQKLILPSKFNVLTVSLETGMNCGYEILIDHLVQMGYSKTSVVSDKGEFAIRGGIVDVFPVSRPEPYRIEFWGDQIESLRTFDPISQVSVQTVSNLFITPAQELELLSSQAELGTLLDYLGPNSIAVYDDLLALEDRYVSIRELCGKPTKTFCSIDTLLDQTQKMQKLFFAQQPIEELSSVQLDKKARGYYSESAPAQKLSFELFGRSFEAFRWQSAFTPIGHYLLPEHPQDAPLKGDEILLSLSKLAGHNYQLHMLCTSEAEQTHLQKRCLELQVSLPENTTYQIGYLSSGFVLHEIRSVVLPSTEITQRFKIRRQKQRSTYHTAPSEMYEICPGETVVHLNNGIGKFLGIERRPNNLGIESEFFLIEYAEQAKLYVPINQAHLISKYVGTSEEIPKLHTLGSSRWKRVKEQTELAIMGYASELLQLQASRELRGGFVYPADSPDILQFEEDFPFVETEDQLQAVAAIKQDMYSSKAMDRLVCGDVGYGKTEVAMRAAFKAVVDGGKQVAVLVPTTVLAMQHYENFVARMQNFPVKIAVLSRFRSAKEIREALEGAKNGTVDILIGTHRLISKDVQFKNLGLVIIDEEQRFGVRAKEHLKKMKETVDCLTMSATPIPRTLYMSLVGAKEMSVINTPPQDRLPIKTLIAEPNEELLKNAILRELARDGQVFFVHNRVETIYSTADRIKTLLPQARVNVVHGQMDPDEIDEVFHAFKNGYTDVLVATTIIENGIDIPNANTILIDRADRFGLAELYQMRGRVGRWNRRAYAYFLIPRFHALPEISRKRLQALAEASGYGGGMKLAMRDLELRGAGNILGTEQSGHVSAIGFYLYCDLLKKTVRTLEGKMPSVITDTKMEFPVDARLPENYVNGSSLRMEFYKRLGTAVSWEEVEQIWVELRDRFGPPPEPALWLYHLTRLRVYASLHGYSLLKIEKLSLFSEQKSGKTSHSRQQLLGKINSPSQLEEKVLELLKRQ